MSALTGMNGLLILLGVLYTLTVMLIAFAFGYELGSDRRERRGFGRWKS